MFGDVIKEKIFWVGMFVVISTTISIILGVNLDDFAYWIQILIFCTCIIQTFNFFEGKNFGKGPGLVYADSDMSDRIIAIVGIDLVAVIIFVRFVMVYWL